MPTIQIDTEELLNAALQMSREELEQFVAKLFTLKARQETPGLSERETELLLKINQGLPPDTQQRVNELIDKRQSYTITQDELQELIQLTDQIEMFDAERLKHLIGLARLRGITLDELIKKLGIKPVPHD
ncbi:MAG: STAS/SEC14 domain-containing protein [Pyrinomonadaceae bacterium]|nr:STAS/SEC14 domain-containing protein [Pyrinomonadaceae bacterium]